MAGRDEEFKRRVMDGGVIDLGAVAQSPPDPRKFPFTLTEVTFRQTYHEWTVIRNEDGQVLAYMMEIIDPADRKVYKYSFTLGVLEEMVESLTTMRNDTAGNAAPAPEPPKDGQTEVGPLQ